MTSNKNILHMLPAALLAFAGCVVGSGDTGDATTENGETPAATDPAATEGAPTEPTEATEDGGQTGETGVSTTGDDDTSSDDATAPTTTDDTGDTTAGDTTTDATTGEPVEAPEIAGAYTDEYGSMHTVDALAWTIDTAVFHVLAVDNAADHLVAQNDAANEYFPELYSRFDWHVEDKAVYYCQTAYDAPSEAAAEATTPADGADLVMGCAGFPWTLLTP